MITSDSVSVVIPVYNGVRYLGEAIESVLAQTRRPAEVLVVDDGSTDGSSEQAAAYGPPVSVLPQAHQGAAAARNAGVQAARHPLLAFLDADDLWAPDKLARQVAYLEADAGLDMVFGQVAQFISPDMAPEDRARLDPLPPVMSGIHAGTLLIRRAAFLHVGYFDMQWRVGEFIDWYARAQLAGLRGYLLPEVLMWRRIHSDNMMRRQQQAQTDYARILKANLDRRRRAHPLRPSEAEGEAANEA